jgi:hypothetical protein
VRPVGVTRGQDDRDGAVVEEVLDQRPFDRRYVVSTLPPSIALAGVDGSTSCLSGTVPDSVAGFDRPGRGTRPACRTVLRHRTPGWARSYGARRQSRSPGRDRCVSAAGRRRLSAADHWRIPPTIDQSPVWTRPLTPGVPAATDRPPAPGQISGPSRRILGSRVSRIGRTMPWAWNIRHLGFVNAPNVGARAAAMVIRTDV